jgi:metal-sulfur cluster biosynthetic enzyme
MALEKVVGMVGSTIMADEAQLVTEKVTETAIRERLTQVKDPELGVDIVSLGLIYDVSVSSKQTSEGEEQYVHILLTLTTPGCPLAGVFDPMIRDALRGLPGLDAEEDVVIELTFDPPWVVDMMSEEAKAELGFD